MEKYHISCLYSQRNNGYVQRCYEFTIGNIPIQFQSIGGIMLTWVNLNTVSARKKRQCGDKRPTCGIMSSICGPLASLNSSNISLWVVWRLLGSTKSDKISMQYPELMTIFFFFTIIIFAPFFTAEPVLQKNSFYRPISLSTAPTVRVKKYALKLS